MEARIEHQYLVNLAEPFVAIDANGDIAYLSESMAPFIRPSKGAVSRAFDHTLMPALRLPVQAALNRVRTSGTRSEETDVSVKLDGEERYFDVVASQADLEGEIVFIVLKEVRYRDRPLYSDSEVSQEAKRANDIAMQRVQMLEARYAASEQQYRSANEELLSMNEELQSSNEELDTSREELQSINEELETINAELSHANMRLTESLNDMRNFLESTNLAVLFLDKAFCVRLFTPEAEKLFRVKERDVGRPIADLTSLLDYPELEADATAVMNDLLPRTREVSLKKARNIYEVRLRPYRTLEDQLQGCVVTFIEITERKRIEHELLEQKETIERQYSELAALYEEAPIGLCLIDTNHKFLRINESLARINGLPVEQHLGARFEDVLPDLKDQLTEVVDDVIASGDSRLGVEISAQLSGAPGIREFVADYYPVKNGEVLQGVGCCVVEVTEQRRLLRENARNLARLEQSEKRLAGLFDDAPAMITMNSGPKHVFTYSNALNNALMGNRQLIGKELKSAVPEFARLGVIETYDRVFTTGKAEVIDDVVLTFPDAVGNPQTRHYSIALQPWYERREIVSGVMAFVFDTTETKLAADRNDLMVHELRHRVKNLLSTVQAIAGFTAEEVDTKEELLDALDGRLEAIARANDYLALASSTPKSLSKVISGEKDRVGPKVAERILFKGDDPILSSTAASAMTLALHELTTNALKYGALKADDGKVQIVSSFDKRTRACRFEWRESGVKYDAGTEKEGFGTSLLLDLFTEQLKSTSKIEFSDDGLVYVLSFIMDKDVEA